jgi:hypothetical protein
MIAHQAFTVDVVTEAYTGRPGQICSWRQEVTEAVAPAREPAASIWERSRAVRDIERIMLPRIREERARLRAVDDMLDHRCRERLWAAGALIELLYEALAQDVRLPLRGTTFAAEVEALLRAIDRWCEEAALANRLAERS